MRQMRGQVSQLPPPRVGHFTGLARPRPRMGRDAPDGHRQGQRAPGTLRGIRNVGREDARKNRSGRVPPSRRARPGARGGRRPASVHGLARANMTWVTLVSPERGVPPSGRCARWGPVPMTSPAVAACTELDTAHLGSPARVRALPWSSCSTSCRGLKLDPDFFHIALSGPRIAACWRSGRSLLSNRL